MCVCVTIVLLSFVNAVGTRLKVVQLGHTTYVNCFDVWIVHFIVFFGLAVDGRGGGRLIWR